ncbi:MAG: hypothetical protein M3O35_12715 [Acidobacteriota bacterium]|nr:hypothetical protein [Acidobacteriota bacterium]
MKKKLLALALLAGGSMFAQTRFSFGINIGARGPAYYAPAPAYVVARPPYPGPGFVWVDGYWAENYGRRVWVPGYWNRPVYGHAYRYESPRYERYEHRDWDRDRDRDGRYGYGFRR